MARELCRGTANSSTPATGNTPAGHVRIGPRQNALVQIEQGSGFLFNGKRKHHGFVFGSIFSADTTRTQSHVAVYGVDWLMAVALAGQFECALTLRNKLLNACAPMAPTFVWGLANLLCTDELKEKSLEGASPSISVGPFRPGEDVWCSMGRGFTIMLVWGKVVHVSGDRRQSWSIRLL